MTQFLKPRRTRECETIRFYLVSCLYTLFHRDLTGSSPSISPTDPELGYEAAVKALIDAHITYDDVKAGVACYCYGDTASGQRIMYQLGMTGIPIYNTNNACATGSTGLHLARNLVRGGQADCVLVVGFEQMRPGSIKSVWDDRPSPLGPSTKMMEDTFGKHQSPRNAQYFGNAGQEYMDK
jgi:sterol carrier protein 2